MPKKEKIITKSVLDIPENQINQYREAFDMFDKDKSGYISATEIMSIMKNFGNPLPRAEVDRMIAAVDDDGNGELDFEEFITLMQTQRIFIDESDDDKILKAFKSFDKDHDGKITNFEFRYILTQLGQAHQFTNEETDILFKECDLDNDGILVYEDFIKFWKNH